MRSQVSTGKRFDCRVSCQIGREVEIKQLKQLLQFEYHTRGHYLNISSWLTIFKYVIVHRFLYAQKWLEPWWIFIDFLGESEATRGSALDLEARAGISMMPWEMEASKTRAKTRAHGGSPKSIVYIFIMANHRKSYEHGWLRGTPLLGTPPFVWKNGWMYSKDGAALAKWWTLGFRWSSCTKGVRNHSLKFSSDVSPDSSFGLGVQALALNWSHGGSVKSINEIHEFDKKSILQWKDIQILWVFIMSFFCRTVGRRHKLQPLGRWMLLWRAAWRIATGAPGGPGWSRSGVTVGFKTKSWSTMRWSGATPPWETYKMDLLKKKCGLIVIGVLSVFSVIESGTNF